MTIARTSVLKKFAMIVKGVNNMRFPATLKHLPGLALPNADEVAAHSDHSHEHEDHDDCTDKYLEEVRDGHQGRENMCFPLR